MDVMSRRGVISDDVLLGAVRRLAAKTAAGASAADLATAIADEIIGLLDAHASAVFRFDGDEIVVVGGSVAPGWRIFTRGARFPVETQMLAAEILATGRPGRSARYADDPSDAARRIKALGYDVVIGAPVRVAGGLWGVIYAGAKGTDRLPEGSQDDLSMFADLCAIAVASAEQRAQMETRAIEQRALMRVARRVLERAPEHEVLAAVAREGASLLDAPAAALFGEADGKGPRVVAEWSADGSGSAEVDADLLGEIRRSRAVVHVGDPDDTARESDRLVLGRPVWWGAPIEIGGRPWGALVVAADKGTPQPPDAAGRVRRFAELAGIAIADVEAREEVEQLAATRRELLVEVLHAEERMRRQIADALHDDVLQELFAARLDLDRLEDDPEAGARARAAVDASARRLRDAVGELHPAAASAHTLEARLRSTLEQGGERAGFGHRLTIGEHAPSEVDDLLVALLREFVHNAVKHADATFLVADVRDEGEDVVLEITDDGRGMPAERPAEALRSGHIGLASTRERVEAIGGTFALESAPGEGTRIRVEVPRVGAAAG